MRPVSQTAETRGFASKAPSARSSRFRIPHDTSGCDSLDSVAAAGGPRSAQSSRADIQSTADRNARAQVSVARRGGHAYLAIRALEWEPVLSADRWTARDHSEGDTREMKTVKSLLGRFDSAPAGSCKIGGAP